MQLFWKFSFRNAPKIHNRSLGARENLCRVTRPSADENNRANSRLFSKPNGRCCLSHDTLACISLYCCRSECEVSWLMHVSQEYDSEPSPAVVTRWRKPTPGTCGDPGASAAPVHEAGFENERGHTGWSGLAKRSQHRKLHRATAPSASSVARTKTRWLLCAVKSNERLPFCHS